MVKRALSIVWRALPKRLRRMVVRAVEQSFTVATGAVILDGDERVLLLKHVFRAGSGWGIPGGFLGKHEQPEDAIRREIREEIGLEIDQVQLALVRTLELANQVEIIFRARTNGEPLPRGVEVETFGWFRPSELPGELGDDQRRIIARVLASTPVSG